MRLYFSSLRGKRPTPARSRPKKGRRFKLGFLFGLILYSFSLFAQSPYHSLRAQFRWGQTPQNQDLYFGQLWYCSGDAAAARGLFRYVREWRQLYQFEILDGEIRNQVPERNFVFKANSRPGIKTEVEPGWWEILRVTEDGHMIVEIATDSRWPQQFGEGELRPSLGKEGTQAQHYLICENPVLHARENWGDDGSNIWNIDPDEIQTVQ